MDVIDGRHDHKCVDRGDGVDNHTLRIGGDHTGGGEVDDHHSFFLQDNMRDDEPFSGEFQRLERLACDTIQRRTEVFNFQSYPHYRHHQIALN